ncbi:SDR family NAD(P)-dependent oxidoreductase [Delftia tsuruhatensis]|uniref:SDR family NAD(P)-dependent oxidoreductase n=1 Tax=Delftia tsuruhatensis TaxID=180282 RepID=UPI002260C086|nr:SDR family NAD(P)-dependent oxidoreductase [Delftia tsuruhatensis]MCX7506944.1 SDR family NAD(P)-dependent oxidoreductase [Delftia tsuruhatensis]
MNNPSPLLSLTILTGASRGMGLAMARQLLDAGHELVTLSRSTSEDLNRAAATAGAPLQQWSVDLGEPEAAARRLGEWLAGLDATRYASITLINNAGVIPQIAPLSQLRPADIAQAMRVGLEAPMLLTASFLAATEGWTAVPRKVLNISSGLGRRAIASQASYCAAKAGMDHFSRSVALDEALKPHGARICSLAPGVIDTDMQVQLRSADAAAFPDAGNFAQLKEGGKLSTPEQAATLVLGWLQRADFGEQVVADVRQP